MNRKLSTEIVAPIDEKVQASTAHYFGLIKEWFSDQFVLVHERMDMLEEKVDRGFAEVKANLDQVKRNTDTNSLDILNLKNRVTRLEKKI